MSDFHFRPPSFCCFIRHPNRDAQAPQKGLGALTQAGELEALKGSGHVVALKKNAELDQVKRMEQAVRRFLNPKKKMDWSRHISHRRDGIGLYS